MTIRWGWQRAASLVLAAGLCFAPMANAQEETDTVTFRQMLQGQGGEEGMSDAEFEEMMRNLPPEARAQLQRNQKMTVPKTLGKIMKGESLKNDVPATAQFIGRYEEHYHHNWDIDNGDVIAHMEYEEDKQGDIPISVNWEKKAVYGQGTVTYTKIRFKAFVQSKKDNARCDWDSLTSGQTQPVTLEGYIGQGKIASLLVGSQGPDVSALVQGQCNRPELLHWVSSEPFGSVNQTFDHLEMRHGGSDRGSFKMAGKDTFWRITLRETGAPPPPPPKKTPPRYVLIPSTCNVTVENTTEEEARKQIIEALAKAKADLDRIRRELEAAILNGDQARIAQLQAEQARAQELVRRLEAIKAMADRNLGEALCEWTRLKPFLK